MTSLVSDKLTERLRRKEHEAFNELVRLCHTPVYRLAQRIVRNTHDAQEVAQETFLAAYVGIDGFQGRANIKTWLLSITYRKAVDRIKSRSEEGRLMAGTLDEADLWKIVHSVEDFTDWGKNPEQNYERGQLTEHLNQALEKVPADSRAVFELRDLQGLSSREASEILGINEGALRVRLHRVRQFLMKELQTLFSEKGEQP